MSHAMQHDAINQLSCKPCLFLTDNDAFNHGAQGCYWENWKWGLGWCICPCYHFPLVHARTHVTQAMSRYQVRISWTRENAGNVEETHVRYWNDLVSKVFLSGAWKWIRGRALFLIRLQALPRLFNNLYDCTSGSWFFCGPSLQTADQGYVGVVWVSHHSNSIPIFSPYKPYKTIIK
jgi:hypothetical protein